MSLTNRWLFVNKTTGTTQNGTPLTDTDLAFIARACEIQLNRDYGPEKGMIPASCRVGTLESATADEKIYIFLDSFPNPADAGASAYHTIQSGGREAAFCAISTCVDLFGLQGVGMDGSHELCEDQGDPGCNAAVDDGTGTMHMCEDSDAVEVQGYGISITIGDRTENVFVSNFLLPSWRMQGAPPPYTFMTKYGIEGGVEPAGPFQTAASPGGNGNYQAVFPSGLDSEHQVFGKRGVGMYLKGSPSKMTRVIHPWTRMARIRKRHQKE